MSAGALLPRTSRRFRDRTALTLAAFGSSTTESYGASAPEHGYPAVLGRKLEPYFPGGVRVCNHGIRGQASPEMDARIGAVIADEPDLVIWQTGSNDAARPVPLDRFEALTARGLVRLQAAGVDLVLMDQQFSDALEVLPDAWRYRAALHRLAAERAVPLFPRHAVMRNWCDAGRFDRTALSPDGTHMTDVGYAALADAVADWLLARLEGPSAG